MISESGRPQCSCGILSCMGVWNFDVPRKWCFDIDMPSTTDATRRRDKKTTTHELVIHFASWNHGPKRGYAQRFEKLSSYLKTRYLSMYRKGTEKQSHKREYRGQSHLNLTRSQGRSGTMNHGKKSRVRAEQGKDSKKGNNYYPNSFF